jgi:cytochrome c oxidase subunit 3
MGQWSGLSLVDYLLDCVVRGFIFLLFQACEYTQALFSINDSVYGGIFYALTGLHGFHVLVGVMSLLITFVV